MLLVRFLQDQRGSLLPTFALATTGVIGFVGAAIDYSRANSTRAAIQAALDATGLILSREAEKLNQAELKQKATDYFKAQFTRPEAKNVQVDSNLTSPQAGSFLLKVSATATVDATVARVLGQSQLNVGSSAEVRWGIKKLELALVLDNTWSMNSSGKMAALKTASHNLLNKLQVAAKEPGDVKVAIIPFDTMVNVGTSFKDEFWINYSVKNIQKSSWTGCVIDRDQSNDVKDTTPVSGTTSTYYPAQNCNSLTPAMQLSTDWSALHTKVDAMAPVPVNSNTGAGYTNVTIGLVWGWHALTSNLPFTGASAPKPGELDKVIVLLTDGQNTRNRWTTSSSSIDSRTATACINVKAADIKIYTVRVIDGNVDLLKSCATQPTMYYDVAQADQLNSAFSSIAQDLTKLRIAK
jgi:Flp pilus assembly protein TadG